MGSVILLISVTAGLLGSLYVRRVLLRDVVHEIDSVCKEHRKKQWVLPNVAAGFLALAFLCHIFFGKGVDTNPDITVLELVSLLAFCGFGLLSDWREFLILRTAFPAHKVSLALRCGIRAAMAIAGTAMLLRFLFLYSML